MAAANNFSRFLSHIYVISALFTVVSAFNLFGESHFNPSIDIVNLYQTDDSYLRNEELSKTLYHVHKRSVIAPPIKKATSSSEKKLSLKNTSTESSISEKNFKYDAKAKSENSSLPPNATEFEVSPTVATVVTNDKSNDSTTKLPSEAISSTTATPSTTTMSTSTIAGSSTVKSTTFEDIPPTRPSNITNTTVDHHVYYNSTVFLEQDKAMAFWVDFDKLPQDKVIVHRMLSDSHRKAATVRLTFDFPFYGHPLRNITIATGGFIYMGDYMHSWLAATQYIAPLMANFDTSLSNESTVRYFDNGTAFVIEWHAVTLQDEKKGGNFTFQTTLLNNGNIIFVYEIIPVPVSEIGDEAHPVKVGLSDAYVIDRIIYFIRRKTIYEYHRIDKKSEDIANHTAIYFTSLTTCMTFRDCKSCMGSNIGLDCVWCESAKRCSDGLDRLRQDWLRSKCDVDKQLVNCSSLPSPDVNPFVQFLTDSPFKPYTIHSRTPKSDYPFETTSLPHVSPFKPGYTVDDGASSSARVAEDTSTMGVGSVVAVLLILAVVMGGLVWVGYAYKNPHTSSGQLLIRYRPSQWRFRSGEARYTAASVHM